MQVAAAVVQVVQMLAGWQGQRGQATERVVFVGRGRFVKICGYKMLAYRVKAKMASG